mmetsp:Transcript_163583/g.524507  ORF Transcript_163583/g.524507 Transcript_163583/m.524507 type:complete len:246 (+) Transcript_163583:354-1091(+)
MQKDVSPSRRAGKCGARLRKVEANGPVHVRRGLSSFQALHQARRIHIEQQSGTQGAQDPGIHCKVCVALLQSCLGLVESHDQLVFGRIGEKHAQLVRAIATTDAERAPHIGGGSSLGEPSAIHPWLLQPTNHALQLLQTRGTLQHAQHRLLQTALLLRAERGRGPSSRRSGGGGGATFGGAVVVVDFRGVGRIDLCLGFELLLLRNFRRHGGDSISSSVVLGRRLTATDHGHGGVSTMQACSTVP